MLGELYIPSGLAFETAKAVLGVDNPHAINVALGCPNECSYCYGPLASRQGKEKYHGVLRYSRFEPFILVRNQMARGLQPGGVFASFLTDPYLPELSEETNRLIYFLHENDVKTATLSKLDTSPYFGNMNGMTIVSPYKGFSETHEPGVPPPKDRILKLEKCHPNYTWVSMEPWPVSEIYPYDMDDIWSFWEDLSFVDFIIFGKWNYDKRARTEKARQEYAEVVPLFEEFCHEYGIQYHVKSDIGFRIRFRRNEFYKLSEIADGIENAVKKQFGEKIEIEHIDLKQQPTILSTS